MAVQSLSTTAASIIAPPAHPILISPSVNALIFNSTFQNSNLYIYTTTINVFEHANTSRTCGDSDIWRQRENMGSEGGGERKLRLLCLHGFRTSGEIIRKQVTGKWPESVLKKLDLVFVDAPFPCRGKSDVEGIFDPPYYEWFQFNKEFSEYENFDECLAFIEDFMIKNGPFDGLLGFSQGAILSAALPGLQAKGVALTRVPKIKVVVIIGGAKFRNQSVAEKAYSSPIQCPSVHFLGDQDFLKQYGTELLDSFVDPLVIRHPKGHTIPRFDEKGLESMLSFLERMQKEVEEDNQEIHLDNNS